MNGQGNIQKESTSMITNLRARLFLLTPSPSTGFLLSLALLFCGGPAQALNLKELIGLSRQIIGDSPYYTSTPKLTDARITTYLNEGQHYAAAYSWAFTKRYQFDLIGGATEYAVPADFATARRVTLDDGSLPETTVSELDKDGSQWTRQSGRPSAYYIYTTTWTVIGFNPVATINSTGTIVLDYVAHVADMVELADSPFWNLPEFRALHEALPKFVAYRYYLLSGNSAASQVYAAEFAADVKRLEAISVLKINYRPGFSSDR